MKLFYFADFTHVKKFATPITYDNYIHLEHGPVPSTILNLINSVENDTDNSLLADSLSIEVTENSLTRRVVPTREFSEKDGEYFSPSELEVLKEVSKRFATKTGKFIEEASHNETAWRTTDELEDIPYTLATGDPDCLVEKEEIELALAVMG